METANKKESCGNVASKVHAYITAGPMFEDVVEWQVNETRTTISQLNPATGKCIGDTYTLDGVFVRESIQCVYERSLKNLMTEDFCSKKKNVAVIVYGRSHTGKSKCILESDEHNTGLLLSALSDIFEYMTKEKEKYNFLRMSYVDVYCEKVEDLLATDLYNDTHAPQPGLQLIEDTSGYVVWLGAKEPIIFTEDKVKELWRIGHNEHVIRGRRTKGRLEAAHSIIRLILESLPQNMNHKTQDSVRASVSYLDFVCVAGSELVPTLTGLVETLSRGPPLTRSLYALHYFIFHPKSQIGKLYDSLQTTLTKLLRDALVGKSYSVFICVCDPCDHQQTHATLEFGRAATCLSQHPCKLSCANSELQCTISKIQKYMDIVQPCYNETIKEKFDKKSVKKVFEKSEEEELEDDGKKVVKSKEEELKDFCKKIGKVNMLQEELQGSHIPNAQEAPNIYENDEKTLLPSKNLTFKSVFYIFEEMKKLRRTIFPKNEVAPLTEERIPQGINKPKRRGRPTLLQQIMKLCTEEKPSETTMYIGEWHAEYPIETRRKYNIDDRPECFNINLEKAIVSTTKKRNRQRSNYCTGEIGSIKKFYTSTYYGSYYEEPVDKPQKHIKDDFLCLLNYLKGTFYVTKDGEICSKSAITRFLKKDYELRNYKPKKVCLPLNKVESDDFIRNDFLDLLSWIQSQKNEFGFYNLEEMRPVYRMPDFIALKEIFVDMYVTPYRGNSHLWKMEAIMTDDGRVYIVESDETKAQKHIKRSHEVAFNAFLEGKDLGKGVETIECSEGQWQVFWGEVDGRGLFYSSKVDVVDELTKELRRKKPKGLSGLYTTLCAQDLNMKSESYVMYKTHIYKKPVDTDSWREYQWNEFLGWWADYQFGKIPNILAGEMEGDTITALRLYSAAHLPELAKVWCHKEAWNPIVCENYLASLLHFIKVCCNKQKHVTLSFELHPDGDVQCNTQILHNKKIEYTVQFLTEDFLFNMYHSGKIKDPKKVSTVTQRMPNNSKWNLPLYTETSEGLLKSKTNERMSIHFITPMEPLRASPFNYDGKHSLTRFSLPHTDRLIYTGRERYPIQQRLMQSHSHDCQVKRGEAIRESEQGDGRKKARIEMDKQGSGERQGKRIFQRRGVTSHKASSWEKNMMRREKKAYAYYTKLLKDMTFTGEKVQQGVTCTNSWAKNEENQEKKKEGADELKTKSLEDITSQHGEAQQEEENSDDNDLDFGAMNRLNKQLGACAVLAKSLKKKMRVVQDCLSPEMEQASPIKNMLQGSPETPQNCTSYSSYDTEDEKIFFDELYKDEDNTLEMREGPPVHGNDNEFDNQEEMVKLPINESEKDESLHEPISESEEDQSLHEKLWSSDE